MHCELGISGEAPGATDSRWIHWALSGSLIGGRLQRSVRLAESASPEPSCSARLGAHDAARQLTAISHSAVTNALLAHGHAAQRIAAELPDGASRGGATMPNPVTP